jgi:tellurite resistance protein TerC
MPDHSWAWIGFGVLMVTFLTLDIGVFHRKSHEVSLKEALTWSTVWIGLALIFNAGIYYWHGWEKALQFFTGYVVELSLSVDNLFVFLLVLSYFKVPAQYRHKVLFWGIMGALVMRAVFIFAGVALIGKFHWIVYGFGALLVLSGIKMMLQKGRKISPDRNPVLRLFRRVMPISTEYAGSEFFVKQGGRLAASPLFVVLLILESTDLVFAVDSVPAVLAITPDPFIIFTSNVFAMLGLRSMFFALEGIMNRFHYLHYGLSVLLIFVGVKMLLAGFYVIPTWASLLIIVGILSLCVVASSLRKEKTKGRAFTVPPDR